MKFHTLPQFIYITTIFLLMGCSSLATKNPYDQASPEQMVQFKRERLPFPTGVKFLISQGAFGKKSHSEPGNEYSWDFDVPYGTPVVSVENGTILEVWEPSGEGGCDSKFRDLAHNIKIEHEDGTVAQYVHISAQVKTGDQVREGQQIGVTALNGWICSPQLHFGIYRSKDHLYSSPNRETLPVSFDGLPEFGKASEGLNGSVPQGSQIFVGKDVPGTKETFFSAFPRVDSDIRYYDSMVAKMIRDFNKTPENPKNKTWVQAKLKHMYDVDQYMRQFGMNTPRDKKYTEEERKEFDRIFATRYQPIDTANTADLKKLLKVYRWFTISEFGPEADKQAWILVQHADLDPEFQKAVLGILTELVKKRETDPSNYAYLFDRVACSFSDPTKRVPQRYGTQGQCVGPGQWQPYEIEDPVHLDERRQEMGLGPEAEYMEKFKDICH